MTTKDLTVTREDLRRFAPKAERHYIDAILGGMDQIRAAGLLTPLRWSHFISQWSHETGGFTIVRERCTWSAKRMTELWPNRFRMSDPVFRARYAACRGDEVQIAELAYGYKARPDLGNSEEGDGFAFRGGSFCQGTGRSWYREAGEALGIDLEGSPDLIEDPRNGLSAAIWYWNHHRLSAFADANNGRAVGNGINRGNAYSSKEPIGQADRKARFERAWAIWGTGSIATTTDLDIGLYSADVKALQLRLGELRYQPGSADGVFGPETGRAVAAFKVDWQRERGTPLEPGTTVGPLTKAALAEAEPIERPEREQATAKDLLAAGSTEMKAGQQMKGTGSVLTVTGGAMVGEKVGFFDWVGSYTASLPAMQAVSSPVVEAVRWGREHALVFVVILAGLLLYHRGWIVQQARLAAHRLGKNLGR